jgi:hypothetical protein
MTVNPINLGRLGIDGKPEGISNSDSEKIFQPTAVEIRPLNPVKIAPVHFPTLCINSEEIWTEVLDLHVAYEILYPGTVEVRSSDPIRTIVDPVDLLSHRVDGEVSWSNVSEDNLDVRAIKA